MNLFYQPRLSDGVTFLEGDEAHHAIKVLRISKGDEILVTDGKGVLVNATITNSPNFTVTQKRTAPAAPDYRIHLFVAPTKNADRMEWLVEKATEIGVTSITMVRCERSERKQINHDRLLKMAISAMKQSQQSWLPEVRELISFDDAVKNQFDQKFIAFVDSTNPDHLKNLAKPGEDYAVLIGPEGDFTEKEMAQAVGSGWQKVSLGRTRLRTETAALTAALTLVLVNS